MGKYFGTDGFRGEANKDLTFEHAIKIGRFLGWYYGAREGKKAKVVIGKDTRRSSYMFEYALCTGLMAAGADAYIMHVTTTPSVSYITRVDKFDCGIMISASHRRLHRRQDRSPRRRARRHRPYGRLRRRPQPLHRLPCLPGEVQLQRCQGRSRRRERRGMVHRQSGL